MRSNADFRVGANGLVDISVDDDITYGIFHGGRVFIDGTVNIRGGGKGLECNNFEDHITIGEGGRLNIVDVRINGITTHANIIVNGDLYIGFVDGMGISLHPSINDAQAGRLPRLLTIGAEGTVTIEEVQGTGVDQMVFTNYREFTYSGPGSIFDLENHTFFNYGKVRFNDAVVDNTMVSDDPVFYDGSELAGSGSVDVEDVEFEAGTTIAPGASPGCLELVGNNSFAGVTFVIELEGDQACVEHDQVQLRGNMSIQDAILKLSGSYVPLVGDQLVVLARDHTSTHLGQFSGLPEGASICFNGMSFVITYTGGDGNDVVLQEAIALPVTLSSFTGRVADKANLLAWKTANEENFDRFVVERAEDGRLWREVGAVAGAGEVGQEQSYGYEDPAPPTVAYYRLRMIDLDGSFTVSPVVYLKRMDSEPAIAVYPNPSSGRFTVELPLAGDQTALLILYDLTGRELLRAVTGPRYENAVPLPAGVYLISVNLPTGPTTRRIVVR